MMVRALNHRDERHDLALLVEHIFSSTGQDFRDYSTGFLRARLIESCRAEGVSGISELREKAVAEPQVFESLVRALCARPEGFYRYPDLDASLRRLAFPLLKTYPSVRLWVAGCGNGEQAYALAVALKEEGLLPRCRIYATDVSGEAIGAASAGVYPLSAVENGEDGYRRAGGAARWRDHFRVAGDRACFSPDLRERLVFSQHSLATDVSFNEFQVIICRDLMPSFNRSLRERAHGVIFASLCRLGVLSLGLADVIADSPAAAAFGPLGQSTSLYRRLR